ncbi:MAG: rod shape-determining protein RodA [Bacteroidales bacterium]|nr:rod shape-determining protein RodA [Bacteroidales bacterium]
MENKIDWITLLLYVAILLFGWMNIYAACYDGVHTAFFDMKSQHGRQLMWMGVSLLIGATILLIKPRIISSSSYIIYLLVMLLMVVTFFVARDVKGGHSWIDIGPFKLQSSEFAKIATALAVAKYVGGIDIDIRQWRHQLVAWTLVVIPMGLTLLQHDMGSALVFAGFVLPMFREGMSPSILVIGIVAAVLFVLALVVNQFIIAGIIVLIAVAYLFIWLNKRTRRDYTRAIGIAVVAIAFTFSVDFFFNKLDTHQQERIQVLLGQCDDIQGTGYNQHQSKIAIGSGGLTGKGFLKGTITKADFVPEQETDFIFCTVGEEWGFLGATALLVCYCLLLCRLVMLAERQYSRYARFYGYSIASILFIHVFINIGMVLGLLPVIGIPLPFFSYGGSSLMAFSLMLAIFLRQDQDRNKAM